MKNIAEQEDPQKNLLALNAPDIDYHAIFNLAAVGIAIADRDGHFLDVNPSWMDFTGYNRDELLSLTYLDITHPDDRAAAREYYSDLLSGQISAHRFETRYRKKNGTICWAQISLSPLQDSGEPLKALIGVAVDITARKEVEKELSDTRNQFQSILEGIKDGVFVLAADYSMHFINHAAAELLGFSNAAEASQAFARKDRDYHFSISDDQNNEFSWNNFPGFLALQGEEVAPRIICIQDKINGEKRWVIIGATPIYDSEGKVQFSASITHEISERVKAQELLEKNEELFRKVIMTSPDAISVTNLDGLVTFISEKAMEIFGADIKDEVVGRSVFEWIHPLDHEKAFSVFSKILSGVAPEEDNLYHLVRKDGVIFFTEINSAPLTDSHGQVTGMISTIRDVTARKKVEADLLQKTDELTRSNRDLEQFAYVASHDLQEPQRKIRSFIDLLQSRAEEHCDSKALEYMGFIQDASRRMQALTSDILQYSRAGTGELHPHPVDLNKMVGEVLLDLEFSIQSAQANVIVDPLPTLAGNESMLRHVFQNLISNAIKYRSKLPPEIRITAQKQETRGNPGPEMWLICVQDNGIGIPMQHAQDVFLAFRRLHSQTDYPGTGIGLAICKKIVERHGGKIWVESEEGKGAAFIFSLPASQEPGADFFALR